MITRGGVGASVRSAKARLGIGTLFLAVTLIRGPLDDSAIVGVGQGITGVDESLESLSSVGSTEASWCDSTSFEVVLASFDAGLARGLAVMYPEALAEYLDWE